MNQLKVNTSDLSVVCQQLNGDKFELISLNPQGSMASVFS
jgi:hypothetical protein